MPNAPVKLEYVIENWWFSDTLIEGYTKETPQKERSRLHLYYCRKIFNCKGWTDKKILENTEIVPAKKPTTFPKFSNEAPFKVKYGKGWLYSPKIKTIRWDGFNWKYHTEKIGHWYNYIDEKHFIKQ